MSRHATCGSRGGKASRVRGAHAARRARDPDDPAGEVEAGNGPRHDLMLIPPSTTSAVPVTNVDSSDAKNSTQSATSRAVPSLPRGASAAYAARNSSGFEALATNASVSGVSILPGHKQFALPRRGASSRAKARVNWRRPPFDATYTLGSEPWRERIHRSDRDDRGRVGEKRPAGADYVKGAGEVDFEHSVPVSTARVMNARLRDELDPSI